MRIGKKWSALGCTGVFVTGSDQIDFLVPIDRSAVEAIAILQEAMDDVKSLVASVMSSPPSKAVGKYG